MRLLLLLLCALSSASLGLADEVVVFTDGKRMTVESYEIKDAVVVITTLEGKLRSLPRSYVDVEATRGAASTRAPAPPEPSSAAREPEELSIPKERNAKVRWAIEHYGGKPLLEAFFDGLDQGMLGQSGTLSTAMTAELQKALKSSFVPNRLFSEATTTFLRTASPAAVDAWVAWLDAPGTRRVLARERWQETLGPGLGLGPSGGVPSTKTSPSKAVLVARLEKTTQILGDLVRHVHGRCFPHVRQLPIERARPVQEAPERDAPEPR